MEQSEPRFLLISTKHGQAGNVLLFWKPDEKGYTVNIAEAGRFPALRALALHSPDHGTYMVEEQWALERCIQVLEVYWAGGLQAIKYAAATQAYQAWRGEKDKIEQKQEVSSG